MCVFWVKRGVWKVPFRRGLPSTLAVGETTVIVGALLAAPSSSAEAAMTFSRIIERMSFRLSGAVLVSDDPRELASTIWRSTDFERAGTATGRGIAVKLSPREISLRAETMTMCGCVCGCGAKYFFS